MNSFDTAAVIDLAEAVQRDGLDAHGATLFALADEAAELGVSRVLVDVMLSTGEPPVARIRAFSLIGAAVAHRARSLRPARHAATPVAA